MPATVRIGTFNCENLFRRFKFNDFTSAEAQKAIKEGFTLDKRLLKAHLPASRGITARAIAEIDADVLALQEVENLDALRLFNTQHMKSRYPFQILVDGNDPRAIDVALLSRHPLGNIRTHQFDRVSPQSRSRIFSRDCLEVDVLPPGGRTFTLFVNHFKSMIGGRAGTAPRRKLQSERVVELVKERFGPDPSSSPFIVLGDLNDFYDGAAHDEPADGLAPLLSQPWLVDANTRIADPEDRWTHHFSAKNEYKQLDYILMSRSLADANPGARPRIERRGLPLRATRVTQKRFPGVGKSEPKASDHCPVAVALEL